MFNLGILTTDGGYSGDTGKGIELTHKHGSVTSDFRPATLEKCDIGHGIEVELVWEILVLKADRKSLEVQK